MLSKNMLSVLAVGALVSLGQVSTASAYTDAAPGVKVTVVEAFEGARFQITPPYAGCGWFTMWPGRVGGPKAENSKSVILAALLSQKSINVYFDKPASGGECNVEYLHINR